MRGLRPFTAVLLSGGMSEASFLSQCLGQASEKEPPKNPVPSNSTTSSGLSPPCGSPPLLSMALAVAAALLLHLR